MHIDLPNKEGWWALEEIGEGFCGIYVVIYGSYFGRSEYIFYCYKEPEVGISFNWECCKNYTPPKYKWYLVKEEKFSKEYLEKLK